MRIPGMMQTARFRPAAAIVAFLALMPLTGCVGSAFGAHVTENYHTTVSQTPKTIELHNTVGALEIEAWNKPDVEIDAIKRGPNIGVVRAIAISVEPQGSTLVISSDLGNNNSNRSVDFTIHAPASVNLNLSSSVGDLHASGFTGSLDASVSTGQAIVTMAAVGGSQHISLDTAVGRIVLRLPERSDAKIAAETSVGAIQSDFPLSIQREIVGSHANGTLGTGSATIDLSTATGAIAIERE
jgi:hypothetical protein